MDAGRVFPRISDHVERSALATSSGLLEMRSVLEGSVGSPLSTMTVGGEERENLESVGICLVCGEKRCVVGRE